EHVSQEELLMNPVLKGRKQKVEGRRQEPVPPFRNEPLSDFSREDARRAMARALDEVRGQLGRSYPPVIGGNAVTTAATIDSLNPSPPWQVVERGGRAAVDQAKQVIAAAVAAFGPWRDTEPRERAGYFFRAADVMRRRRFDLSAWEVYECGKQWREA